MWSGTTVFRGDGTTTATATANVSVSSDDLYNTKRAAGYGIDIAGNQYRGAGTNNDPLTVNGQPFTGTWQGKSYQSGILVSTSPVIGDGSGVSGSGISGAGTGTTTATPTLARDTFKNTLALFFGANEASKAWVDQLYNVVSKYYKTGSTIDEAFNLSLQDARNNPALSEFTRRFKGIYALQDMRQAGKPVTVPTIAEYVASQSALAEYLSMSGLSNLATEDFTGDILGKGISVSVAADRLAKVFDRIDKAPRAIKDKLS